MFRIEGILVALYFSFLLVIVYAYCLFGKVFRITMEKLQLWGVFYTLV